MYEYLFNVLMSMALPTFLLVVVFAGLFIYKGVIKSDYRKLTRRATTIVWLGTLAIVLSSTSITYKHETFDKVLEQRKVEVYNEQTKPKEVVIKDLSKPISPNLDQDFDKMVDYKETK